MTLEFKSFLLTWAVMGFFSDSSSSALDKKYSYNQINNKWIVL